MNRIDRLMATLLLLQGRRVIRAEEIAAHFEISLRTVYRDVAALSEAGVPVVAEAGVGYSLLQGYSVPPVMFTPEEAGALFLAGDLVDHLTDRSMQAQMRSALLKIRAVLPRSHQDRLDRLAHTTALLLPPPTGPADDRAALARIQSALAQRRVLELRYRSTAGDAETLREVEPLGLLFYADHWHLIAWCRLRRDLRDFRTDRIVALAIREESFSGHRDFSLRDHVRAWRVQAPGVEIVLRVDRRAASRLRRAWMGSILDERVEGDRVRLTVMADECGWLAGWLLGFGTALEVVAPESLRRRLSDLAREVAAHHGTGTNQGSGTFSLLT